MLSRSLLLWCMPVTASLTLVACATEPAARSAPAGPRASNRVAARGIDESTRPAAGLTATSGREISASALINEFRPEEELFEIDIERLNLKQVFESADEDVWRWYQHVQTLADPFFEGRVNGSEGTRRARAYIAFHFDQVGLEPAFPAPPGGDGSSLASGYEQPFDFASRASEVTVANEHAAIADQALISGEEFVVLGNTASGDVSAPVTFVGYAIESGVDDYSSFDDATDLSGRVALVLRYEPLDEDGVSLWSDGSRSFSRHASLRRKMSQVQERGAVGIVLVNPPGCREGQEGLESLDRSSRFGLAMEVPVIQLGTEVANGLAVLADPDGRDLMDLRRLADAGAVTTVDFRGTVAVTFGAEVERTRESIPAANVGGVLRGRGALADEWLVIGAHYDHNGYGRFGTDPDDGPLFPGADDNASGTAGVLVLARKMAEAYAGIPEDADCRSVLFIAFDAEERGLHGSRHFARNPIVEPEQITALLNMDMIGRLRSDELSVLGTGTGEGLPTMVQPHFDRSGLQITSVAGGSGRSDDANFHRVNVPAMHFFTGMHAEYTSPQDKAHTVNPFGADKVVDLIFEIGLDLATRPGKLVYAGTGRGRERGPAPIRLGIRPDLDGDVETGVLVAEVAEGTSAAKGGIRPGDLIVAWNGEAMSSMRSLVEHLRVAEPDQTVTITVLRDGASVDLPVTLQAREGE